MKQDDKIVIIGAGVFGLCLSLQLAIEGHSSIVVVDRHFPPVPDSSSSDISRVIRFDYSDETYSKLAYAAYLKWRDDAKYKGIFTQTAFILAGTKKKGEKSWIEKTTTQLDKQHLPWLVLKDAQTAKGLYPILTGELAKPDFDGYRNEQGGWADANKAILQLRNECIEHGVSFICGPSGTITSFESGPAKTIKAACTMHGDKIPGDHFILTAGAWSSTLVQMYNSTLATAQVIAYLRLTEAEMEKYKNLPIYANYSTGWFNFPPHPTSKTLKMAIHGWGYTLAPEEDDAPTAIKPVSSPPLLSRERTNFVPEDGEFRLRQGIREILPELADRSFEKVVTCWYTDTPTGDFIMDYHPDYTNLFVGGGGSGHAFKFLPILGEYLALAVKRRLPGLLADKWRFHTEYSDQVDAFAGDGSRGGPERREFTTQERLGIEGRLAVTAKL